MTFEQREIKRRWVSANPWKVRYANQRYRELNRHKTNNQARLRMRRYRAGLKAVAATQS